MEVRDGQPSSPWHGACKTFRDDNGRHDVLLHADYVI